MGGVRVRLSQALQARSERQVCSQPSSKRCESPARAQQRWDCAALLSPWKPAVRLFSNGGHGDGLRGVSAALRSFFVGGFCSTHAGAREPISCSSPFVFPRAPPTPYPFLEEASLERQKEKKNTCYNMLFTYNSQYPLVQSCIFNSYCFCPRQSISALSTGRFFLSGVFAWCGHAWCAWCAGLRGSFRAPDPSTCSCALIPLARMPSVSA